ncbi:MAG: hypothetical protein K2N47_04100 [Clostridia bacterium]|nr:hypothetical protein [Clostridia bacterium]
MKGRKVGKILFIVGTALMIASLVVAILIAYVFDGKKLPTEVMGIFVGGILVAVLVILAGAPLMNGWGQIWYNRIKYEKMPYREMPDYKQTIDGIRERFAADTSKDRNRVPKMMFRGASQYYDFSAIDVGKIYYGCLVEANSSLFRDPLFMRSNVAIAPAVFVYSTDPYYDQNPEALQEISQKMYANRHSNILKDESGYFSNYIVDKAITGGREVFMTCVLVACAHLPLCKLSGSIVPIIADPDCHSSAFIVDVKYWGADYACHYAHADNTKKRKEYRISQFSGRTLSEGTTDFYSELQTVKSNYIADNDFNVENEEDPFGKLGAPVDVYYAYVASVDKKLNNPYDYHSTLPAVALYSPDEYYANHPFELAKIAAVLEGSGVYKHVFNAKKREFASSQVPTQLTEEREVYLTAVLIERLHMPLLSVSCPVIPVVKDMRRNDGMLNSIDYAYWSEELRTVVVLNKFNQ